MTKAPTIKEALERIQGQIADLQGEHEVMAGPFDASKWKIEASVADLQTIVAALATLSPPAGERREAIARLKRLRNVMQASQSNNLLMHAWAEDLNTMESVLTLLDRSTGIPVDLASGLVQDEAGWRDISTAPKDVQIWAWGDNWNWQRGSVAVSHTDYNGHKDVITQGGIAGPPYSIGSEKGPTNWMPLPAPPIRSARRKRGE